MIEIKGVSKFFGEFTALKDINIEIEEGIIYGIIGENGAGKTTLLQMIAGIYDVDEGDILIDGESIYENNNIKNKIGYVADRNQYFKDYRVKEMVEFYSGVYENFSIEDFKEYNKVFKLNENKKIKQLSKGMQMRLSLMLNLSINPKVLILDEPTSGLDAIAKKDLIDILIKQVDENNTTVIISSHHIGELEKICDQVAIINNGKLKYKSDIDGIKDKVKKLQVIFEGNVEEEIKEVENILNIEKVGSIYYIVTDKYGEKIIDDLQNLGASLIEVIGISLEEIFIYMNRGKDGGANI